MKNMIDLTDQKAHQFLLSHLLMNDKMILAVREQRSRLAEENTVSSRTKEIFWFCTDPKHLNCHSKIQKEKKIEGKHRERHMNMKFI